MSTEAQILANRANSQSSTGPATTEGKEISSQNRRSHGLTLDSKFILLPSEDAGQFQEVCDALHHDHTPTCATEALLVEKMAQHHWLRDRALRNQTKAMDDDGLITDRQLFMLYLRYHSAHDRAFHKCLNDLLKLRAERTKAEIGFEREKRAQGAHRLNMLVKKATSENTMFQASRAFPGEIKDHIPRVLAFCSHADAVYEEIIADEHPQAA